MVFSHVEIYCGVWTTPFEMLTVEWKEILCCFSCGLSRSPAAACNRSHVSGWVWNLSSLFFTGSCGVRKLILYFSNENKNWKNLEMTSWHDICTETNWCQFIVRCNFIHDAIRLERQSKTSRSQKFVLPKKRRVVIQSPNGNKTVWNIYDDLLSFLLHSWRTFYSYQHRSGSGSDFRDRHADLCLLVLHEVSMNDVFLDKTHAE